MSKYGNITYNEVCKLELKEMDIILDKYEVSNEDKESLRGMLKEAYYQAHEMAEASRVLNKILENNEIEIDINEYMIIKHEEEKKYPFDVE